MKRIIFTSISLLFFAGCASSNLNVEKGVIVNVYESPTKKSTSLVCKTNNTSLSYIYVGKDSVSGNIASYKKNLIASYAKAALKETSVLTPVSKKYIPGYDNKVYPILKINVIEDKIIKTKLREDIIAKKGIFTAQISITVPGSGVICSSSKPVSITLSYQEPIYKENMLPTNDELEKEIVKNAIKEAVSSLVPVSETIFRPVETGSGVIDKSADLLNNDNCDIAKDLLSEYTKTHKDNAKAFYNLGVSYECLTKGKDLISSKILLQKALKAYTTAVMLDTSNEKYNKARKDILLQLKVLKRVKINSKNVKDYIKEYN